MKEYILALDQGTTSSRAIIFDKQGNIIAQAGKEYTQIFPTPGWVEHDPMEIWSSQISTAIEVIEKIKVMAKINMSPQNISAIGITNQRETTIVWNRHTGKPVYNAIVWQCRRTADYCQALKTENYDQTIQAKTGLIVDPYFSATKVKWILENVPGAMASAKKGDLLFGTVDTWLTWNLTKGQVHVTDYSNASRTMMFNIHTLTWDTDILQKFGIPESMLPTVMPSSHVYGHSAKDVLGHNIPIAGIAGDQQAALFGQNCFTPGMVKNTYGTGCFILMHTGKTPVTSQNGLITTIAWGLDGTVEYALEGGVFIAGAAIQWLRDSMQIITHASETETIATSVPDTQGVYVVPAFVGLGAPYWQQEARGIITGLTRGADHRHIVRATLESLAYQSYDVIKAMERDINQPLKSIKVDGGAVGNDFLMQFQADILGVPVIKPKISESTALGAMYLAGLGIGMYSSKEDILQNVQIEKTFQPNMAEGLRKDLLKGWQDAIHMLIK